MRGYMGLICGECDKLKQDFNKNSRLEFGLCLTGKERSKMYTLEEMEKAYVIFTIPAKCFDTACVKINSEYVFLSSDVSRNFKIRISNYGQSKCTYCQNRSFMKD